MHLDFKAKINRAKVVLAKDKIAADEGVEACSRLLHSAVGHLESAKGKLAAVNEKINALQATVDDEQSKMTSARSKAQAIFDECMKGSDEAAQVTAAKQLAKADTALQTATKDLSPDALRLRALSGQANDLGAVVDEMQAAADEQREAHNQALFRQALVHYDEAVSQALVAACNVAAVHGACAKKAWLNDFGAQSFWVSSGHRAVTHLANPTEAPVNIAGHSFQNLLTQGSV